MNNETIDYTLICNDKQEIVWNKSLWEAILFKSGTSSRLVIENTIAMVEIIDW